MMFTNFLPALAFSIPAKMVSSTLIPMLLSSASSGSAVSSPLGLMSGIDVARPKLSLSPGGAVPLTGGPVVFRVFAAVSFCWAVSGMADAERTVTDRAAAFSPAVTGTVLFRGVGIARSAAGAPKSPARPAAGAANTSARSAAGTANTSARSDVPLVCRGGEAAPAAAALVPVADRLQVRSPVTVRRVVHIAVTSVPSFSGASVTSARRGVALPWAAVVSGWVRPRHTLRRVWRQGLPASSPVVPRRSSPPRPRLTPSPLLS
jgi:hypothetical protein